MTKRGRPRHPDVLTPREWEVLSLIRDGLTNEQIAERIGVTIHAARYHVSQILSKLGVATREEAAAWQPEPERAGSRWIRALQVGLVLVAACVVVAVGVLAWGVLRDSDSDVQAIVVRSTTSPASRTPTASESPTPSPIGPTRELTGLPVFQMQIVNLSFGWTRTISGIVRRPLVLADGTDAAEGRRISPPDLLMSGIGGAFFLDEEHGWLLTSEYKGYPPIGDVQRFVYRTSDGGQTWLSAPMGKPRLLEADRPIGRIEFIDPNHGWVLEIKPTSTQSSIGTLYGTDDGGVSWTKLNAPSAEPIHFTDVSTGWQTSGPFTGTLYVSHDGGVSWTSVFPQVTLGASPKPEGVAYGLPTKLDDGSLVLPVSRESKPTWSFQLMTSVDGGETWRPFASAGGVVNNSVFDPFVSFIFPNGRVVVMERSGSSLVLPAGSSNFQPLTTTRLPGVFDLQFADENYGWALLFGCYERSCENDLLPNYIEQTDDGGQTWSIVNSPGHITSPPPPTP